jgi:hypothetical protein
MANKKIMLGMLAVLVLGMALMGCATNAGRYDNNSPAENDCKIILDGGSWGTELTKITSFDGNVVDWRSKAGVLAQMLQFTGPFSISIPAGEHSLTAWSGQVGLTAGAGTPQMSTTYTFVAGHTYKVKAQGTLQIIDVTK